MYLSHLVKGLQLNDCDATSWYVDRVRATAKGPPKSEGRPFAARPAVSKAQPCQLVRAFFLRDGSTLLVVASWIILLRAESETIPMRKREPAENMSEMGQARSHSLLGVVGGCLVLKLRCREHMATGAILTRACRC